MRTLLAAFSCALLLLAVEPRKSAAEDAESPYAQPSDVFQKKVPPPPRIPLDPPLRPLAPDEVKVGPLLESLEGVAAVTVRGPDNQMRLARQGEMLQPGDSFQTGEKGSARVVFEKGVQVLVASGSVLTVGEHGDVPVVTLDKGEARSVVETGTPPGESGKGEPKAEETPQAAARPYKFYIRTPAAVMGVRGTDFVVQAEESKASVHTLTGIVDVGRDLTEVKTGQGVPVPASHSTQAEGGKRIQAADRYDVGQFLKEFNGRNPKMEQLWNAAARDVRTGRLKERFGKLRKQVAKSENLKRGLLPEVLDKDKNEKGAPGRRHDGKAKHRRKRRKKSGSQQPEKSRHGTSPHKARTGAGH